MEDLETLRTIIATQAGEIAALTAEVTHLAEKLAERDASSVDRNSATRLGYIATDLDGRADVGLTPKIAKERAGEGCDIIIPLFDLGNAAPQPVDAALDVPPAPIKGL